MRQRDLKFRTVGELVALCLLFFGSALAQNRPAVELSDVNIQYAIEADLMFDEVVDINAIDVSCDNGVVTLSGTAGTILEKERAERISELIRGVTGVVNRIVVRVPDLPNDSLEKRVEKKLLYDPVAEAFEIDVECTDGKVLLHGRVQSWAEKTLVSQVVKGVTGVTDVVNSISVSLNDNRADSEIRKEIQYRYKNDVRLSADHCNVTVNDGEVSLSGSVGSVTEKRLAYNKAWVIGVEAVDDSKLAVKWWLGNELTRKDYYADRSDKRIETGIVKMFYYDPRVYTYNPEVYVENGVVTLSGVVDNVEARRSAERDAKNVVGVKQVKNLLKVRPKTVPDNASLESRVDSALKVDPFLSHFDIDIDAQTGKIVLRGTVNTSFEKQWAETVVGVVPGVVSVQNKLQYEYAWNWKPDWEIKADVNSQLEWSTLVNEDSIAVSVNDGVVRLEGSVNTWGEWFSAEKNAFEGGAKDVRNNLRIRYSAYGRYFEKNRISPAKEDVTSVNIEM